MNTEIVVAIITAVGALLGAVIGLMAVLLKRVESVHKIVNSSATALAQKNLEEKKEALALSGAEIASLRALLKTAIEHR